MTYDLTWTFNINQAPASQDTLQHQCQSALFFLKSNMLTAGWTVVSSSDGSTQGASDLWSTSANCVWNTNAAARSWILLKSPVGIVAGPNGSYTGDQSRLWYCLECVGGSSSDYSKFNQTIYSTVPTGGSTTAIPTGGDAQSLNTSGQQFIDSALTNSRFHFAYTSQGGFYLGISKNTSQQAQTLLTLLPLVNVNTYSGLDYPFAAILNFSYTSSGNHDATYFAGNVALKAYAYDGTAGSAVTMWLNNNNGGNSPGYSTTLSGDINGNNLVTSMYLYINTTNKCMLVGRIPDIYVMGATAGTFLSGSGAPASGGIQYSLLYRLWFPANANFNL